MGVRDSMAVSTVIETSKLQRLGGIVNRALPWEALYI